MSIETQDLRTNEGLPGCEPEIGRLLWMMEEGRGRTLERLAGLDEGIIDWAPSPRENSIGGLLYHIALVEADWLFVEVLEQEAYAPDIAALFTEEPRDERGHLAWARGTPMTEHLDRLARVRAAVLETFRGMSVEEFRRPRELPDYTVSPEWVLHHLLQHEAEHRGELGMLRVLAPTSAT